MQGGAGDVIPEAQARDADGRQVPSLGPPPDDEGGLRRPFREGEHRHRPAEPAGGTARGTRA